MDESLLSLILLALAASFLPLQFGFEIDLLGKDEGIKKGVSFTIGVTLFRIVFFVGLGVVFVGLLGVISNLFTNISTDIKFFMHQFGLNIRSGQYVLFDGSLIFAGIALWLQVYHHLRNRSKGDQSEKSNSKGHGKGTFGLLFVGFSWVALSLNQWIFMSASVGQILSLSGDSLSRLFLFCLFLLIASLMLLLPIIFYLVWPQNARKDLEKFDKWLNGAIPYIVVILLFGIGLYFIVSGITGVMKYLAS